ncbi:MAG: Flp pilus assembly protein CpaB [Verrucomicrobiota bacterium]
MAPKGKFGLLIVLALLMAGVSLILVVAWGKREADKASKKAVQAALEQMQKQQAEVAERLAKERTAVVVANGDIAAASIIFPEMVQTKLFPPEVVPPNALTNVNDATNRVSMHFIPAGDIIMDCKAKPKSDVSRPSFLVEKGKRYITLSIDPAVQGVAAMIRIGDIVDILATYGDTPQNSISKIIVQKAKVIDVAYGDVKGSNNKDSSSPTEPGMPEKRMGIGDTVTFEVNPDDAEMLKALESSSISYKYLLRNYQDDAIVETPGRRTSDVISGLFGIKDVAPTAEAPPPPAPNVF